MLQGQQAALQRVIKGRKARTLVQAEQLHLIALLLVPEQDPAVPQLHAGGATHPQSKKHARSEEPDPSDSGQRARSEDPDPSDGCKLSSIRG